MTRSAFFELPLSGFENFRFFRLIDSYTTAHPHRLQFVAAVCYRLLRGATVEEVAQIVEKP